MRKADKAILDKFTLRDVEMALARQDFYEYCRLLYPSQYSEDKPFLKAVCNSLQDFIAQSEKHILVLNLPPRHYKSFTATCLTEWLFGRNSHCKVMTGSYNEIVSATFATKVRDAISQEKVQGGPLVYNDIFPQTKIKYGQASASKWALDGSTQTNYLATSPTGTATGFGANIIIIDDIIKSAEEAYNELALEKDYSWFNNTIMQRLEGNDWKIIVIMTRWATNDLAGRIIEGYGETVEQITYKAIQNDGSMLCPAILSREDYELRTREMNRDIAEANYNQAPIDITGRMYNDFKTWEELPAGKRLSYTDTADTGADFTCSICYIEADVGDGKEAYITDLVFSDEPMEKTEPLVAGMFFRNDVEKATVESNNGGRGFRRNVERLLREEYGSNRTVLVDKAQRANKEARILSSESWVKAHIYMPKGWKQRFPEFYQQVASYQRKGRNAHDDGVDVLAAIYEHCTERRAVKFLDPVHPPQGRDRVWGLS